MKHKPILGKLTGRLYQAQGAKRNPTVLSAAHLSLLGFLGLILVGTFLLYLPVSQTHFQANGLLTALFESTSAVCVTGLSLVDISTYYSLFGQLVILLLIQIGGLGYMTLYSLMLLAVGRKLSLRERLAMQQVLDLPGPSGVIAFILKVLRFTLVIEGIGAALLAFAFVPSFGLWRGLYLAVFHAVSAFNNAGFSLFSDSLMGYATHPFVLPVIALLVILGAMGYPVLSELWLKLRQGRLRWSELSLLSRLGLLSTLALLGVGTLLYLGLETLRPETLGNFSGPEKLLAAFFMAVMPRTAGFNALDIAALSQASLFITLSLMLVGANPGGTGGGVKTTTLVVVINQVLQTLRGRSGSALFKRTISDVTERKAWATLLLSILWINSVTILLTITESDNLLLMLFEVVSAFATVGLSMNYTSQLSAFGQILIILTMYVGRVGILTVGMAIWQQKKSTKAKYPEESLMVG